MAWNSLSSTNRHSECGDSGASNEFQDMLDATAAWLHVVNEVHWAVLDLGSNKDIKKLRFKRFGTNNPTDMDIYITTSLGTGGNDTTWETAVATAIDIQAMGSSWVEVDVTDKTGRYIYFHINGTQHASDYLAWGDSTEKVIEYWDGDLPKRYKTVIPMRGIYTNNFSTSFYPTDGRYGLIPWDGSKYNNIIAAYLVATGKRTGTSGADPNPMWIMELYDRTNTIQIGQVSSGGTVYETDISGDISANLPSGVATLDVRYKQQDSSSSQHTNFELHIVQENETTGNKTRVYIPVGSYKNSPLTAYNTFGAALGASALSEHHLKWVAANWSTVSAAYFSATLRALSGKTVSLKLDDIAAGGALATFTHNTTTYTLKTSSDISSSLVDGTTYTPFIKTSATPVSVGDICSNAFVIVDITDPDKLMTFQDVGILGNSTTTAGWTEDVSQQVRYLTGAEYYSTDITEVVKYQGVAKHTNDTSMSISVYDDGTRDTAADLTTTATVNTWLESGAITPATASEMTFAYNLTTAGFLKSGQAKNGMLAMYLTDLLPAGATPVSITKSLDYQVVQDTAITKSLQYQVTADIPVTKSLDYQVVATATAITKSLQYEVIASQSTTRSLLYKIKKAISTTRSLDYKISATISAITKALEYQVKATVAITKSLEYKILATASAITKSLEYRVKTTNSETRSLAYEVTATPSAITKALEYKVKAPVAITKSLAYEVIADVAITKSLSYEIINTIAITKSLAYEVTADTAITKALEYQVIANIPVTKSLDYQIATDIAIQKSLAYKIIGDITIQKSLAYKIKATNSETRSLAYDVITSAIIAITKSLQYQVTNNITAQRSLDYNVISTVAAITKSLDYKVQTATGIQKGLDYEVAANIAIEKSLKYTVIATTAPLTRDLDYKVVITASAIQKSLTYEIHIVRSGTPNVVLDTKQGPAILQKKSEKIVLDTNKEKTVVSDTVEDKNVLSSNNSKSVIINKDRKTKLSTKNNSSIISSGNNKNILTSLNNPNVVKSNKDNTTRLGTKNNKTNL